VLTALVGLEEGAIKTNETITDRGVYTEFKDYQPACWIWNDYHGTHGSINVVEALKVSCNYFFYEVGNRLGISKLNKYGELVGLGQPTGIEIGGESAGIMAGPEYREKNGKVWYGGDTLQSAIGQSDNLLTPLQLASYIATIVNGGTRYKPHLLKSIKSYDVTKTGGEKVPEVVSKLDMKKENYEAIIKGLSDVSQSGTAANVFANYKVSVGSKTGTATASKSEVNAVFVAVAPLEAPEIAIAIVIEKGGHGSYAAPIAKDVMDVYFAASGVNAPINKIGELLQ
jgi:penicillin-binding protein 2